jgi:hypothetical protein
MTARHSPRGTCIHNRDTLCTLLTKIVFGHSCTEVISRRFHSQGTTMACTSKRKATGSRFPPWPWPLCVLCHPPLRAVPFRNALPDRSGNRKKAKTLRAAPWRGARGLPIIFASQKSLAALAPSGWAIPLPIAPCRPA